MSILPPTSNNRTPSDDAPRAERAVCDEVALPKPAARHPETLDAPLDDLYDNVACTD
jgi:hypothetical protein